MKGRQLFRFVSITIVALSAAVFAEMPAREQRPPAPPPPPEGPRGHKTGGRGEKRVPPPVERFMQMLEEEDSEEYQGLQKLRESDKDAFRVELRERLSRARRRSFGAGARGHGRDQSNSNGRGERHRPQQENEYRQRGWNRELQEMVEKYHEAEGGEKESIRSGIKSKLEEIFSGYQQRRIERLERLETKIEEMREMIKEQNEKRDSVIDRQLELLLQQRKSIDP